MTGKKDDPKPTPIADAIKDKDAPADDPYTPQNTPGFATEPDQRDTTGDQPA